MTNTRRIDSRAQKVFKNLLPDEWLPRERSPDIHVDYAVEIADQDPTGEIFLVQLKGTEKPRYKGNTVKLSLKTKHLAYYLKKLKQPVFVVLVDTKAERAFWIFTQEWLREHHDIDLDSENRLDIEIPLDNDLSNTSRLIAAVQAAETFMRELWPSSVHASVRYTKELYERIDGRFTADVAFANGKTTCSFLAKEPVDISLGFDLSAETKGKMIDVVDRGRPARFTADEIIAMAGSPLFEHFQKTGKLSEIVIRPDTRVDAQLSLSVHEISGKEITAFHGIHGVICRGRAEAHYEGAIPKTPLSIRIIFPLLAPHYHQCSVNIRFESSGWDALPILNLPYFDKLHQLYRALNEGRQLKLSFEIAGEHVFSISSSHDTGKGILGLAVEHLTLVNKVRNIFRKFNKNAAYPISGFIDRADRHNIELIHALITDGRMNLKGNGVRFKGKLKLKEGLPELEESGQKVICLTTESDNTLSVLGQEIEIGAVSYALTYPVLSHDLRKLSQREIEDGVNFEITGTEWSEFVISKA